jgi:site-specific recombinase XerD
VPHVTLHQFRHSCASDLLQNGVSLPEVQQMLGHAVIASTQRYTEVADPQRVEAMRWHPINEFLRAGGEQEEGR